MHVQLNPTGVLNLLSKLEVDLLQQSSTIERYRLFRNCVLAVLNVGSHTDSSYEIYNKYQDFDITLLARERGIKIELTNPPESAFVDGKIIAGIHEHIFSVIRDILFIYQRHEEQITDPRAITHMVFDILRNADALEVNKDPNMVVCWGGHSINEEDRKSTRPELQSHSDLGCRLLLEKKKIEKKKKKKKK